VTWGNFSQILRHIRWLYLTFFVGYPGRESRLGCRDGNPVSNQLDHPDSFCFQTSFLLIALAMIMDFNQLFHYGSINPNVVNCETFILVLNNLLSKCCIKPSFWCSEIFFKFTTSFIHSTATRLIIAKNLCERSIKFFNDINEKYLSEHHKLVYGEILVIHKLYLKMKLTFVFHIGKKSENFIF